MSNTYFYRDKPLFSIDIGHNNLRLMQLNADEAQPHVIAYGQTAFPPEVMKDGVIVDPATLADAVRELITNNLEGKLTTKRVALSVPSARSFSRAIKLPRLEEKDIKDAVRLEAEQYIPENVDKLYLDYTVISRTEKDIELFAVAAPKEIIDSYIAFAKLLNFDPVVVETSIHAATRLFQFTDASKVPSVLVDFGAASADITIVDKTILATGTVSGGGDNFVARLVKFLGVTDEEARTIIAKYGLNRSSKQAQIREAIKPELDSLYKEIRRMLRYYEERYGTDRKINQIVLMGSANIPGLNTRLTDELRIPVRDDDPWENFVFDGVQPFKDQDKNVYMTAAGLAMIKPEVVFA